MERYICIHGHFYQPPRENPWLEAIELQDSAAPYHDWNERITAECYAPNAASRILDEHGMIERIVNNYSHISFNVGPTLLAWMEDAAPKTYRAILEADRLGQAKYSGHGTAIAQVYNHMIMPLANRRDKVTQVRWGVYDFEHRFGRRPEGMWLAETAVDLETLEVLADHGIAYTILSPYQAGRVRRSGDRAWHDVSGGRIDPTMAYRITLPSRRTLSLFFYDGPISRGVAFEGLLNRGEILAGRLVSAFSAQRPWAQLVHIATDGETYGHHHPRGDMALAYALHYIEDNRLARLTNYGEYLELHPPTHEVQIIENTSWSCSHGIERWQSNCGCNTGGHAGWIQEWRQPLRDSLNWLRDRLAGVFEEHGGRVLNEPWQARDDYIQVILDRSEQTATTFLTEHAGRELTPEEAVLALRLLEMQRHGQLMFTSCGWFFDELSGIETVQVLQYAGRAIQLARDAAGVELEEEFLQYLERAQSNIPQHGNGRNVYRTFVVPAMVDLEKAAGHYAISSAFEAYSASTRIYSYHVDVLEQHTFELDGTRVLIGRISVEAALTWEARTFTYAVLHNGDQQPTGWVQTVYTPEGYDALVAALGDAHLNRDAAMLVRQLQTYFGGAQYSLQSLFRDERRKIIGQLLRRTLIDDEAAYRTIYERTVPVMRLPADLGAPLPRAFLTAAEFIINHDLSEALQADQPDTGRISALLDEVHLWQLSLDSTELRFAFEHTINRLVNEVLVQPGDLAAVARLQELLALLPKVPFTVDLWEAQNTFWELLHTSYPAMSERAAGGDEQAAVWVTRIAEVGPLLMVRVAEHVTVPPEAPLPDRIVAEQVLAQPRIPLATYRLQLHAGFTFRDATALVGYLNDLGVSDCYLSPIFQARSGSTHGYDVANHRALNPAIGSQEDYDTLARALDAADMGVILDVVPNHMGIGEPSNVWWMDVLENGPASPYARFFDIDWHPVKPELANKVLLPILGDAYGKALESGNLQVSYQDGEFRLHYYETVLPLAPRSYAYLLRYQLRALEEHLGADNEAFQELESILNALDHLPLRSELDLELRSVRMREKVVLKRRLASLYRRSSAIRDHVQHAIEAYNGVVGSPHSFDPLDELLNAQAYRLAYWRVAQDVINYRRFFDINDLAAIRVELPEVFAQTHDLVLDLLVSGRATGLRIDHPDGLWDPRQYFQHLQRSFVLRQIERRLRDEHAEADVPAVVGRWFDRQESDAVHFRPLYVVAEKILAHDEQLPTNWAIHGTTGYDFLSSVNGLFVDSSREEIFDHIYASFIRRPLNYPDLVNANKKMIMLVSLASEINALSHQLERIVEKNRWYRDFTLNTLTFAIREIIAALPVYRTYVHTVPPMVSRRDAAYVDQAVEEAKRRNPRTAGAVFDFVGDTLLLRNLDDFEPDDRSSIVEFTMKFQQLSGPVMAKGVEDTTFYVYNRLVSLNEVGGEPDTFGITVAQFHEDNARRQRAWPHSMLTTSTHDTKRGEDVRARINVLSELADEWQEALQHWSDLNAPKKVIIDGQPAPSRNDEYLLYQTLLGAWPVEPLDAGGTRAFRARIQEYMAKATKEAKVHTSWINPNEAYDAAVQHFVDAVLSDTARGGFIEAARPLQQLVAYFGQFNGLSQALLKLTSPGVPDLYQGCELWNLSLVDPDNRRPVDFDLRRRVLSELRARLEQSGADRRALLQHLLATSDNGHIKLFMTYVALAYRRTHPDLFRHGSYDPVEASGTAAAHVCAFARRHEGEAALVVVPRVVATLMGKTERPPLGSKVWRETQLGLPPDEAGRLFRNVFTGEVLTAQARDGGVVLGVADVLRHFPVALLDRLPPS